MLANLASKAEIEIVNLQDAPQFADACAAWSYGEWGSHIQKRSLNDVIQRYRDTAKPGTTLPQTWVAVWEGKPAGMVSLKDEDHPHHTDIAPWIASVFVHPYFRGCGLSNRLLDAACAGAKALGHKRIYLYTGTAEALYAKNGFRFVRNVWDPAGLNGDADILMEKDL